MKKAKEIILGVTGGIAAYKACDILRRLQERGLSVTVVMTVEAKNFVTPLTFASLSGKRVYSEMVTEGQDVWDKEHIALAEKADLILIAPATANIIGKIANGLCDDLLSCVTTATGAPIVMAPAMNTGMFKNKIVQENIQKLKNAGIKIITPKKGRLACGSEGIGHLADLDDIVRKTISSLK